MGQCCIKLFRLRHRRKYSAAMRNVLHLSDQPLKIYVEARDAKVVVTRTSVKVCISSGAETEVYVYRDGKVGDIKVTVIQESNDAIKIGMDSISGISTGHVVVVIIPASTDDHQVVPSSAIPADDYDSLKFPIQVCDNID